MAYRFDHCVLELVKGRSRRTPVDKGRNAMVDTTVLARSGHNLLNIFWSVFLIPNFLLLVASVLFDLTVQVQLGAVIAHLFLVSPCPAHHSISMILDTGLNP